MLLYDSPVSIPGGFFSGQVFFPKDGVLARTFALEMECGNPRSRQLHAGQPDFEPSARRCKNSVSRVTISWSSSVTVRLRASSSPTTVEYWLGLRSKELAT